MRRLTRLQQARLVRAARRELRKRRERAQIGRIWGQSVRLQNFDHPSDVLSYPTREEDIVLGGDLDLLRDTDATLDQLLVLENRRRVTAFSQVRVRVLLDLVRSIDAASLLLMCSRIRELGGTPFVRVSGTYPRAERARRTLRDANFQSFISRSVVPRVLGAPLPRHVELIEGMGIGQRQVRPEIARQVQKFLHECHPTLDTEEVDTIGVAIAECLENVRIHAYGSREERRQGWYVVGLYDEERSMSTVAILDVGVGIAATVAERVGSFIGSLFRQPADYVEEAISGKVTASGQPHRGKGFRFLREFVSSGKNRRLHVLSSSSVITWGETGIIRKEATREFRGTIVCLEIQDSPSTPLTT